ncbi:flagellar biosynthetic protein FliO [Castellaniella sp. GW247-6E4]|uniref:flagellar biosynthetic protein FliO n=1 Tax=Castellaniella sp. GW247-6E4 TaxID=3140380 RepID=UPI003315CD31
MNQPDLLRVTVSLLLIVGLLLALAWAARRGGWLRTVAGRGGLKVSATQRLGARASLAIVEVEDARLVLGVTAQQITLLHTLPPAGADAAAGPARAFSDTLGQAISRH